jgi:dCMP deaminase
MIKDKLKQLYIDVAHRTAQLSYAEKLKVGAILVKNDNIISFSWNGTPRGWNNNCEDKVWMNPDSGAWLDVEFIEKTWPHVEYSDEKFHNELQSPIIGRYDLKTKPYVSHAEEALLMKIASSHESSEGASLFCTHSCCINCAKLIYGAKISEFYYTTEYKSTEGIDFLKKFGISVNKLDYYK